MKRITLFLVALFSIPLLLAACGNTVNSYDGAEQKLDELTDEYGTVGEQAMDTGDEDDLAAVRDNVDEQKEMIDVMIDKTDDEDEVSDLQLLKEYKELHYDVVDAYVNDDNEKANESLEKIADIGSKLGLE
jgi:hypothetical protein